MNNNVNPNNNDNNLEQNTTTNVPTNNIGSIPNQNVSSTVEKDTSSSSLNDVNNSKREDQRFKLFKQQEENTTPTVIMSKKMSEELEAKKRKEREESEKYEPVPVSKGKYMLMIVFFIFMFALVYFLPNITNFVSIKKAEKEQKDAPIITTGLLTCKLDKSTDRFNINYTAQFNFSDSKLDKLTYVTSTRGDAVLDSDSLDDLMNKCRLLRDQVNSLDGIKVNCSQSDSVVVETQSFTYASINEDTVTSAYIEAGGVYPEFKNEQNIDTIEKNMNASGYTCERTE